jgi:hypothetical protein
VTRCGSEYHLAIFILLFLFEPRNNLGLEDAATFFVILLFSKAFFAMLAGQMYLSSLVHLCLIFRTKYIVH